MEGLHIQITYIQDWISYLVRPQTFIDHDFTTTFVIYLCPAKFETNLEENVEKFKDF